MPPGATSSRFAAHKPGTREIFHVFAGQLEVCTAQETVILSAGDTATLRVDMEHWFTSTGKEPARLFLTVLGP
ncbi:cupin domain-containing protein [Ensifer canadensis]